MHTPRIYINIPLATCDSVTLDLDNSKHLLKVLRKQIGDQVLLFNNTKGEFQARITAIKQQLAIINIEKFIDCDRESPIHIHLGQSISRGEKMDFTIQKAVELGVHTITPLFTEFGNVKLEGERLTKKLAHWQAIAIHASEQSGRTRITTINPAQKLSDWMLQSAELRIVLCPTATQTIANYTEQSPATIALLIGPEGGLSDRDLQIAIAKDFKPIRLGPRILRTETAALTAISIIQSCWGDLDSTPEPPH